MIHDRQVNLSCQTDKKHIRRTDSQSKQLDGQIVKALAYA